MKASGIISWIVVGVLSVLLVWSLNTESGEPVVIEKHTADTLVIERIDTVTITKVKVIERPIHDTTYITIRDSIFVPIPLREYRFSEEGVFEFNVKGFDVSFISAQVYPNTITQVVTNTVETTNRENKSAIFIYGGFSFFGGSFFPKAGASISLKNKWLISGDIGLLNKEPIYGLHVGYNILNNR